MGQVIAGLISPIRQKDGRPRDGRAIHHSAQSCFFVLFVFLLDNDVCINAILQIVKHVQMPKIPAVLTLCPRPVGGGIPGVCGGLQVRPVRRQQTVSLKTSGGAQAGGKPPVKRFHRRGQQLFPLLDKRRGRRCVLPVLEAFHQNLPNTVFAHGEQQGYHCLKTQCPGSGEVSSGPPDKPLRRLPQFPNQRTQHLSQYDRCVFHVWLPPEKQFHFSGLRRTFFRFCQSFFCFF